MKRYKIRFINEEAIVQPAIVSGNTTQEEMENNTQETE
jgi:hypothetical protein